MSKALKALPEVTVTNKIQLVLMDVICKVAGSITCSTCMILTEWSQKLWQAIYVCPDEVAVCRAISRGQHTDRKAPSSLKLDFVALGVGLRFLELAEDTQVRTTYPRPFSLYPQTQ